MVLLSTFAFLLSLVSTLSVDASPSYHAAFIPSSVVFAQDATPSATLTPTASPSPTFTPTPTATLTPTSIPPTSTPTPTPTPDAVGPAVTITSPEDGGTAPRRTTVTITASATDPSGVDRVDFYVNSVLLCTDSTTPYTCNWDVHPKKNVIYNLVATAHDSLGNVSSDSIVVTSQ